MSRNITDLNYDSKLATTDFKFKSDADEQALLERTQIVFGGGVLSTPRYGIRDVIDPRNVIATDTARPLHVGVSNSDPLKVNINAGSAVCPNGTIVTVPSPIIDFALASTNAGDILVVYAYNLIVDAPPIRATVYNYSQNVRRVQDPTKIYSALLSQFTNSTLFPPDVRDNIVVLSVINVVAATLGTELQIDYSNSTYSFNRPWYSPVDVEHRSLLGSGSATVRNPHGTSYNDLTSGNLTLYDQLLSIGYIQSRDNDIKGVPGILCTETVLPSGIATDTLGTKTAGSRIGGVGKKYIELSRFPINVNSFYVSATTADGIVAKSRSIAFDWIPGTRIVVIPDGDVFAETATIYYTYVQALEPPSAILSNTLTFNQPSLDSELVYSGGISFSTITNPSFNFDGSGPFPKNYKTYLNSDGTILRAPQIVVPTIVLDSIGTSYPTSTQGLTFNQYGPANILVGLADANPIPDMRVTVAIYGKDSNNASISETLTFGIIGGTFTASAANPTVITSNSHGLSNGQQITVAGSTTVPNINGTYAVTVTDSNNFTIPVAVTTAGAGTWQLVGSTNSWTAVSIPNVETPSQYLKTVQVFAIVTGYQILTRYNDGPSAKIILMADLESGTTPELNRLALISQVRWDGLALQDLIDLRKCVRNIPEEFNRYSAAASPYGAALSTLLATPQYFLASEDLRLPKMKEIIPGYSDATESRFSLFVRNWVIIVAGDILTITQPSGPAAVLTAITVGVPNRTIGQFLSATSNQATADDIVATFNDPTFSALIGFSAVNKGQVGVSTTYEVVATRTGSIGNLGNQALVLTLVNGGSLSFISGGTQNTSISSGGYDAYGETFLSFHQDYIDTALPSDSLYDVTDVRGRYLTRAIPISSKKRISILLHDIQAPFTNVKIRARVAFSALDWQPWEVIAPTGLVTTFTKPSDNITKVQFEFFGKIGGFSIYEGDI